MIEMNINKDLEKAKKELAGAKEEFKATQEKRQALIQQANQAVNGVRDNVVAKKSVVDYLEGLANSKDDRKELKEEVTEVKEDGQ
jgi:predicted  nucleic acid-binding Zn-ribbon protein